MLRTEELRAFLLEFLKTFCESIQTLKFQLCLQGVERLIRDIRHSVCDSFPTASDAERDGFHT